jgi:hypothetical protein
MKARKIVKRTINVSSVYRSLNREKIFKPWIACINSIAVVLMNGLKKILYVQSVKRI